MPSAYYYEKLNEDMRARYPEADRHLLEHLSVLEPFLHVCIVSGFSLGALKSADKLAQKAILFLGEICAREGRDATDHHVQAIRDFKPS